MKLRSNMKRLVAIDLFEAVYIEDGLQSPKIDYFECLDKLLSIRTAENLIEFLHDFPEAFGEMYPWLDRNLRDSIFKEKDSNFFSERSLLSAMDRLNSKKNYGIEWVDQFNDALTSGIGQDKELALMQAMLESYEDSAIGNVIGNKWDWNYEQDCIDEIEAALNKIGRKLYSVPIASIEVMQMRIENLLSLAAVANGRSPIEMDIEREISIEKDIFPERLSIYREDASISLDWAKLISPFSKKRKTIDSLESFSCGRLRKCRVKNNRVYFNCFYSEYNENNFQSIINAQYIAQYLTAWALTAWLHAESQEWKVEFNDRDGFSLVEARVNELVKVIIKTVSEDRVGICKRCERPFIARRLKKDGGFYKDYCTKSCANLVSRETSNG